MQFPLRLARDRLEPALPLHNKLTLGGLVEITGRQHALALFGDINVIGSHCCCVAPPEFNAVPVSLVHQPCGHGAGDEHEHRIKYDEPDRRICDGQPVCFESYLCLNHAGRVTLLCHDSEALPFRKTLTFLAP
jgi:hypothetical protein